MREANGSGRLQDLVGGVQTPACLVALKNGTDDGRAWIPWGSWYEISKPNEASNKLPMNLASIGGCPLLCSYLEASIWLLSKLTLGTLEQAI